ncbi:hypothetical protein CSV80_01900 [Sporosarcina sp. P12(2017)]|uniref:helix-turn-helix domain-containing protein n=1 Tax=unclassified Sporosarcina TaxID=2647733 RepID=UPI000C16A56A|nr:MULTISPECIES: helix-turn-helix domain-containing protein [unclassified Sporosarcina]PIC58768.1 hypothetical protein CSV81_01900 [Sporosarcina sp. P10]PIC62088.1 hypothetical protein CSV80_01900 [Sporosarcina sp. P12(2017)]
MGILLALLFILQIIGFMVMTLLYLKISKFNNLEKKQQQLMKEMDQSVLAYLGEIKEENDRLIHELNQRTEYQMKHASNLAPNEHSVSEGFEVPDPQSKPHPVPVHFALRSYQKTLEIEKNEKETKPVTQPKPLDDRQKAKQLYAEGTSIVDIARELKKGKTEIELLLKFE